MTSKDRLKSEIMQKVAEYYSIEHSDQEFVPGKSRVKYAGRVFDERDMNMMVASVLDFWLTAGPYAKQFELELGKFLGVSEIIPVNSGSSANLVAVTALCSRKRGEQRLVPGDEVSIKCRLQFLHVPALLCLRIRSAIQLIWMLLCKLLMNTI